ncbi:MAG TPA: SPFH domain-containing protein [Actinocrinis sp.]
MSSSNAYLSQVVREQASLEEDLRRRGARPAVAVAVDTDGIELYEQPAAAPPPPGKPAAPGGPAPRRQLDMMSGMRGGFGEGGRAPDSTASAPAVQVRITGTWRRRTVLVPPNAFVVHTRRGRAEPLHLGVGISFRFNPVTDTFLVVPGATQTILISAHCICRELQGILVQAYVQWIIHDFATAYRRLDFSDPDEPMRLVNIQLREQAEAAIKDKVATMAVRDVLSDKQPIIEELTSRLRAVAEGEHDSDQGLGLRIVTVQIKEAVVSSGALWENLQKPYRSEQQRIARLAELEANQAVSEQELAAGRLTETRRLENERQLAELRDQNAAVLFDREAAEALRRDERRHEDARAVGELEKQTALRRLRLEGEQRAATLEQQRQLAELEAQDAARAFDRTAAESLRRSEREHIDAQAVAELDQRNTLHALQMERDRQSAELETGRMRSVAEYEVSRLALDGELALAAYRAESEHQRTQLTLDVERSRAEIENNRTPASINARLVAELPQIVERMPAPAEIRSVTIGGTDRSTAAGLIAELAGVLGALRTALDQPAQRE